MSSIESFFLIILANELSINYQPDIGIRNQVTTLQSLQIYFNFPNDESVKSLRSFSFFRFMKSYLLYIWVAL